MDLLEFMAKSQNKRWSQLSLWEKLAIFNYWSIMYLLSNFCLMIGCLIFLFIRDESVEGAEVFLGFGCFFAWASLPSYLHQTA
jgi:hypothetical protein